jgi:hypothetical protein
MAKSKAAKRPNEQHEGKPKEPRLSVSLSTHEVMVGMEIVVTTNRDGYVEKTIPIKTLETGEGCRNLHVNDTACYDRGVPINIAFVETEALNRMVAR